MVSIEVSIPVPVAVTLVSEISIFWYRYRPPLFVRRMTNTMSHQETLNARATAASGRGKGLFVLNLRCTGDVNRSGQMTRDLERRGWKKIGGLTNIFVKEMSDADAADVEPGALRDIFNNHTRHQLGAEVKFAISKLIPPNEMDGNLGLENLLL